jgi:hypothetical protein
LTLIDCTEESKKNYSALSETFASFQSLKGAGNVDQLSTLSKDISQTFQQNSLAKQTELEQAIDRLKEPIDEYRLMIEAAGEACLRRRKQIFRFYEMQEQIDFNAAQADSFD